LLSFFQFFLRATYPTACPESQHEYHPMQLVWVFPLHNASFLPTASHGMDSLSLHALVFERWHIYLPIIPCKITPASTGDVSNLDT
jgi:hypothetical protein